MAALCYNTRLILPLLLFSAFNKNGYHAAILDTDVAGPFIPKCLSQSLYAINISIMTTVVNRTQNLRTERNEYDACADHLKDVLACIDKILMNI